MRNELANAVEQWADVARKEIATSPNDPDHIEACNVLQILLIFHAALVSNRVDVLARFMGERIEEELAVIQKMKSASTN